jgi:ATP-binding cassette subfamily B protein
MRGQRLRYFAAIAAIVLWTLFVCLVPLVSRATIDSVIEGRPLDAPPFVLRMLDGLGGMSIVARNLWIASAAIVVLTALAGLFMYFKGRWSATASESISRNLRDRLYDHLQHLPCRYHDRAETGDILQRCSSDVETFREFLSVQVVEVGRALIMISLALAVMLSLDVNMTLVSMILLPPIFIFSSVFFVKVRAAFLKVDEAEAAMTTVLQENLTGIRVVRSFSRMDFEIEKFARRNAAHRELRLRLIHLLALYWGLSDILSLVQIGLVLVVGGAWLVGGGLTVGTLFAFVTYVGLFLWPVRQMGRILTDLGRATVALGRIQEVLDQTAETGPDRPAPEIPQVRGEIVAEGLTFSYGDSTPVLKDVSLRIMAGKTVAFLGPSGSGKSTFIQLLLRLYDYRTGSIRIDGVELASLDRKALRSKFGVVLQEPFLYSRSIRENIRLGDPGIPDPELEEAARTACIHDAITAFDQGYETVIGERGVTLSGGQRQRMAIARALVLDPAVLILDDALSAVDTRTEAMIQKALHERGSRQTTILISHRLTTLQKADWVYVFEKGVITQSGTPDMLRGQDGLYRRLWKIQSEIEGELKAMEEG